MNGSHKRYPPCKIHNLLGFSPGASAKTAPFSCCTTEEWVLARMHSAWISGCVVSQVFHNVACARSWLVTRQISTHLDALQSNMTVNILATLCSWFKVDHVLLDRRQPALRHFCSHVNHSPRYCFNENSVLPVWTTWAALTYYTEHLLVYFPSLRLYRSTPPCQLS